MRPGATTSEVTPSDAPVLEHCLAIASVPLTVMPRVVALGNVVVALDRRAIANSRVPIANRQVQASPVTEHTDPAIDGIDARPRVVQNHQPISAFRDAKNDSASRRMRPRLGLNPRDHRCQRLAGRGAALEPQHRGTSGRNARSPRQAPGTASDDECPVRRGRALLTRQEVRVRAWPTATTAAGAPRPARRRTEAVF